MINDEANSIALFSIYIIRNGNLASDLALAYYTNLPP